MSKVIKCDQCGGTQHSSEGWSSIGTTNGLLNFKSTRKTIQKLDELDFCSRNCFTEYFFDDKIIK